MKQAEMVSELRLRWNGLGSKQQTAYQRRCDRQNTDLPVWVALALHFQPVTTDARPSQVYIHLIWLAAACLLPSSAHKKDVGRTDFATSFAEPSYRVMLDILLMLQLSQSDGQFKILRCDFDLCYQFKQSYVR